MRVIVAVALLAAVGTGCGVECYTENRTGTYREEATATGGTCGDLAPVTVRLRDGVEPGVAYDHAQWSDGECTLGVSLSRVSEGTRTEIVSSTTQDDADGGRLSGDGTVTVYDLEGGDELCTGSYDFTYVRQ